MVIREPANIEYTVGTFSPNTQEQLVSMIEDAQLAFKSWSSQTADVRASLLERTSRRVEENWLELVSLLVREAGKTYGDAVSEVREAVDFLRYYAVEARRLFGAQAVLPGPTGERNTISWHGRGVFACISPWNFPLAIFTGQIAAALAAGNTVIAKPAEQTPLIAQRMIELFHSAGIPKDALALALGTGEAVGATLVANSRIAGVAFTGSVPVAQRINRSLAARESAIVPLIADDRWAQCNDRGLLGAARTSGRRRHHLRLSKRRTTLLRIANPGLAVIDG